MTYFLKLCSVGIQLTASSLCYLSFYRPPWLLSSFTCVCVCVCESLSHVRLFAIPWTPALQADSSPSEPLRKSSLQGILPIYLQGPKTQRTEQRRVYSELEKLGSVLGLSFKSHLAFFFEIVFSAIWETWVQSLGCEDPLEKGMATYSSILAWRFPWTLQSMGSQRVGLNWAIFTFPSIKWR